MADESEAEVADEGLDLQDAIGDDVAAVFDELEHADDLPEEKAAREAEQAKATDSPEEKAAKDEARQKRAAEQRRKEDGKFAGGKRRSARPTEGIQSGAGAAGAPPLDAAAQEAARVAAANDKAPQSWTASAKAEWAKMPPAARGEVMRREREVASVLEQSAQARRHVDTLSRVIAPFQGMIQAEQQARGEQYDPFNTIQSLLGTAALLRTGTAQQKVDLVSQIISDYGLTDKASLEALDKALTARLSGQATAQPQQQAAPQYRDPRVDQLWNYVNQGRQQAAQAQHNRAQQTIASFAVDPKHDLIEERGIKVLMGNLMSAAADSGLTLGLEEAYQQAIQIDPETRKVVEQRRQAEAVKTRASATSRSRAAATSLRPASGAATRPASKAPGGDLHDDIQAAMDELEED